MSAEVPARGQRDYAVVVSARGFAFLGFFVVVTLLAVMVVHRATQVFAVLGAATTAAVIAVPFVRASELVDAASRGARDRHPDRDVRHGRGTREPSRGTSTARQRHSRTLCTLRSPTCRPAARQRRPPPTSNSISGSTECSMAPRRVWSSATPIRWRSPAQVAKVIVVGVLAAFIVAGGRRVVDLGLRFARRTSIREEFHAALASAVSTASGTYLRRMIAVSVVHGLVAGAGVVGARLTRFDLDCGAWVAVASTVPILGGALAWLPVVALATVNDVPLAVVDRYRRRVHRWRSSGAGLAGCISALRVGPLLALLGIGIGLTVIGVSGAILGLFVVAFVSAMLSHRGHLDARSSISSKIRRTGDAARP